MQFWGITSVVFGLIVICLGKDLPSYFPRCNVDDKNLRECLIKATETMRPYIKKGVPEVDIPSFNPLRIPRITMEQGTSNINYKVTLTDVEIRGMDEYKFMDFDYDVNNLAFHGVGTFSELTLTANYEVDGKFLLVPIQGKGVVTIKLKDSSGMIDVKGKLETRNGEEYYVPESVRAKITVGDGETDFKGLFGGNSELSNAANQILKENSKELIEEITPAVEKVAADLISKMMTGLNKNVPYKNLLPASH